MIRRVTGIGFLAAFTVAAFWAGSAFWQADPEQWGLLGAGVTMADRVASLRRRVAAVERENENLRTELRVRTALERSYGGLSVEEKERIVASILEAHNRYNLSTEVLLAVIEAESGFTSGHTALPAKGYRGRGQARRLTISLKRGWSRIESRSESWSIHFL